MLEHLSFNFQTERVATRMVQNSSVLTTQNTVHMFAIFPVTLISHLSLIFDWHVLKLKLTVFMSTDKVLLLYC
jgi:hypothetical protein